jgi:hypothetical protein
MQALFEAAKESVQEIGRGSRESPVYKEECLKLGRYVSKVTLILAELELQLYADESLRGSEDMFIAVEGVLQALQQAASLVHQCSSTSAGRIWPMEDAVAFQSVGLELLNAMEKVASAHYTFPEDLHEDIEHFLCQLQKLKFTEAELEESAVDELTELQKENKKAREDAVSTVNEEKKTNNALFDRKTPSALGSEPPPSQATSNIKPFRSAVAASAAAVEELDDTWEEIEHEEGEESREIEENDGIRSKEDNLNTEEKEETFEKKIFENDEGEEGEEKERDTEVQAGIPPPDEKLLQVLNNQGVAYVDRKYPFETALPPDAPIKGAVEEGKEPDLPCDPFRMQEGTQAQIEENARLSEGTIHELEELKKDA